LSRSHLEPLRCSGWSGRPRACRRRGRPARDRNSMIRLDPREFRLEPLLHQRFVPFQRTMQRLDGIFGGTRAFHIWLCYWFCWLVRRNVAADAPASHRGLSPRFPGIPRTGDIAAGWRPRAPSLAKDIGHLARNAENSEASLCSMNFQYPKFRDDCLRRCCARTWMRSRSNTGLSYASKVQQRHRHYE
jgi:hypothetical protein